MAQIAEIDDPLTKYFHNIMLALEMRAALQLTNSYCIPKPHTLIAVTKKKKIGKRKKKEKRKKKKKMRKRKKKKKEKRKRS